MPCFLGQCNKEADALKPLAPAECMVDPADLFPFRFIEMDEDANYALFPKKLEVYIYLFIKKYSLSPAPIPYLKTVCLVSTLSKVKEKVRLLIVAIVRHC